MKIALLLIAVLLLASCQVEEPTVELSDVTEVYSKNTSKVQVYQSIIYVQEELTINELFVLLASTDDSIQSYQVTANDGSAKSKEKLFEFDRVIVTSESGQETKTYSVRYIIS